MNTEELKALSHQGLLNYEDQLQKEEDRLKAQHKKLGPPGSQIKKAHYSKFGNFTKERERIRKKLLLAPENRLRVRLYTSSIWSLLSIPLIYYLFAPIDIIWPLDTLVIFALFGVCGGLINITFGKEERFNGQSPKLHFTRDALSDLEVLKKNKELWESEEQQVEAAATDRDNQANKITARLNEIRHQKQVLPSLKSRATERERTATIAAFNDQARTGAATIRAAMINAHRERNWSCPYCLKAGDINNAHADHIYPTSRGGRSVPANMVLVCADCNSAKSNKTLRTFSREQDLNFDEICQRLELMGKDV